MEMALSERRASVERVMPVKSQRPIRRQEIKENERKEIKRYDYYEYILVSDEHLWH